MSHLKERKEKDCLNCGAQVTGRYCQVCGQENIEPKETFWHLVMHFFNDITHFDGKFFTTTKALLFKPGFLPGEYHKGRRASYLNPIRMYVFTSFLFFLVFFSITGKEEIDFRKDDAGYQRQLTILKRVDDIDSLLPVVKDTLFQQRLISWRQQYTSEYDSIKRSEKEERLRKRLSKDSIAQRIPKQQPEATDSVSVSDTEDSNELHFNFGNVGDSFHTVAQYEAYQNTLPDDRKDGWLSRTISKKLIRLQAKYRFQEGELFSAVRDHFVHSLPQMFFVSLPFFALILQLLYFRRKDLYYVDHGIFSVYHFIATYIILLFVFLLGKLTDVHGFAWVKYPMLAMVFFIFYYLYKSMRVFYQQGRAKTMLKFFLLFIISAILLIFLSVIFLMLTFFNV